MHVEGLPRAAGARGSKKASGSFTSASRPRRNRVSFRGFHEREPRPTRFILHVDLDAFYASVEVRENPALAGLPVIVGADPKQGRGRGVVTTASYEARKFGVRSAMPISQAYRLCPNGVYVFPNFPLYGSVSGNVFEILRGTGAIVEGASIDEAYLDASRLVSDWDAAAALARRIQAEVVDKERITCSIGVAPSKLVAKIATDMAKPNGVTLVREGEEAAFLAPLPARKMPGVGPKTELALDALGFRTCGDLASAAPDKLARVLGSWGPRLAEMARGIDDAPVSAGWDRKSLGSEGTFDEDVADQSEIRETVDALAREVAASLAEERLSARTVTLKIRLSDFTTFTRARTLPSATTDADAIAAAALDLLAENWPAQAVRLLGVRLTHLSGRPTRQVTLQEWPADILGEDAVAWEPPQRGLDRYLSFTE